MLRTVHDLATGEWYTRDFILVSDPMRIRYDEHHDDQLDLSVPFKNHTRPTVQTSDFRCGLAKSIDAIQLSKEKGYKVRLTDWRKPVFDAVKRHGDFAPSMVRAFTNILDKKDYFTALAMVQEADSRLRENGIRYAKNDDEIVELAKAKSKAFSRLLLRMPEHSIERFHKAERLLAQLGLSFRPELVKEKFKKGELDSLVKRACCDKWLRRQLRRQYFARVEEVARDLLLVHKSQDAYCSSHSKKVIQERASDTEQYLTNTVCYVDDDPSTWFTLQELSSKSPSNPKVRLAEMFVRLKAFEEISKEMGHVCAFYTLTAPSRFHVYKGSEVNPAWLKANKPSAVDAHRHLMKVMDNVRKELDKLDIKVYGLRVVEPHHDGTPHQHVLFFMEPQHEKTVSALLRKHALSDSPNEPGAKKYRFKRELIDNKKGSAVGYVAKYLSKNVDGSHIDSDRGTDLKGSEAASSVVSFNRIQGIRQFQFYGGPSVTAWREMRRLREEIKEDDAMIKTNQFTKDEHFVLETIRKAADEGDFKRFIIAMGGVFVKRNEQTLKPLYVKKVDVSEVFKHTRYGDEMAASIQGVLFKGKSLRTRFKDWRFANKKQFIRGVRMAMQSTTLMFDTLEEEHEYYSMLQEEYERMKEEALMLMDSAVDPSVLYMDEVYSLEEYPPDEWWAQPSIH